MRLTLQEVIEDAKKVIAGKEDYIYVDHNGVSAGFGAYCAYFDPQTGAPSCIVGHIFALHGITYENVLYNNGNFVGEALQEAKVEAEPAAIDFMKVMQSNQDLGSTWGYSFEKAMRQAS